MQQCEMEILTNIYVYVNHLKCLGMQPKVLDTCQAQFIVLSLCYKSNCFFLIFFFLSENVLTRTVNTYSEL